MERKNNIAFLMNHCIQLIHVALQYDNFYQFKKINFEDLTRARDVRELLPNCVHSLVSYTIKSVKSRPLYETKDMCFHHCMMTGSGFQITTDHGSVVYTMDHLAAVDTITCIQSGLMHQLMKISYVHSYCLSTRSGKCGKPVKCRLSSYADKSCFVVIIVYFT